MKYCTSCGAMSGRKICKACGVKENKEHKYCGWCGAPLNENAAVCTNCGMKVKPNRLFNVIGTIVGIFLLLIAALSSLSILAIGSIEMRISAYFIYISTLAFAGILCFPFADRQIKAAFLGKKFARQIAPLVRIVLVVVLVMVANKSATYAIVNPQYSVNPYIAEDKAVTVFHENVSLKNEDSFVINDYKVYSNDEPYKGYENLRYVKVVLDYSAQNGFGGNNRTKYTIEIYFDTEKDCYYRLDGTLIE